MKKLFGRIARWFVVLAGIATVIIVGEPKSYLTHVDPRPYLVTTNPGGGVLDFILEYDNVRRSGRQVVVDGICISACTLVVGLVPLDRVCMTPFGQFAFHSAYSMSLLGPQHSSEGTRLIWQVYPEAVRAMLRARGFNGAAAPIDNRHPDLIYFTAEDMRDVVRGC